MRLTPPGETVSSKRPPICARGPFRRPALLNARPAKQRGRGRLGSRVALLVLAASALSCNALLGGGVVALVGGAGLVASQCYDRVRVRVRDADTGRNTCEAEVWLTEGDSERRLRPCYSAALTEGQYRLTARRPGYTAVSVELEVKEREGRCPHYTRTVEFTLRREGSRPVESTIVPRPVPAAPSLPPGASPPRAPAAPGAPIGPPIGAEAPRAPTRAFDPVAPGSQGDAGAAPPSRQ
jgi:hypothetical protein